MYCHTQCNEKERKSDIFASVNIIQAIYDGSTGLLYLNARFYDPATGRFTSQDSYRGERYEPDTWHLYAYCANDPVDYIDSSGHLKKHWWNSVSTVGYFIDVALAFSGIVSSIKDFIYSVE